ncbi:MAG: alpha/beta hydrolase [Sphingomonas parapaucimobilis]
MAAVLRLSDPFSIITLPMMGPMVGPMAEPGAGKPDGERSMPWESLFAWPRQGDLQIPFDGGSREARDIWATRLDHAVAHADKAVLLVAEGAACLASIWWARLSPSHYVSRVAGALFFQPPSADPLDRQGGQLFASPEAALPFPSLIVDGASHSPALASICGGRLLAPPRGAPAPTGMWRQAQRLIERFSAGVVEQDMRVLRTLGIPER